MSKYILTLIVICSGTLTSTQAWARTSASFAGINNALVMSDTHLAGSQMDSDAQDLFNAMAVPSKPSMIGDGKALGRRDINFIFVCADRKTGEFQCSITTINGPNTKVDPISKTISVHLEGDLAHEFYVGFHRPTNDEYHFVSSDNKFKVDVTKTDFHFEYSESGVGLE